MPTCVVPGCGRGPNNGQVRLHSFPKDENVFKIWKERIANPRIEDSSKGKGFVCERHFIKECQSPGTKRLRKFSLPTIECPGFTGTAALETSFLYPPRQLNPEVEVAGVCKASNEIQPQPHCSKDDIAANNVFMDLTDSQVDEDKIDVDVNEQVADIPKRQSPDLQNSSEIYPIFIDLVDVKQEEEVTKETECPGIYDSNDDIDPLEPTTSEATVENIFGNESFLYNGVYSDPFAQVNSLTIDSRSNKVDLIKPQKISKACQKTRNFILKDGSYSKKLIQFAKSNFVPRRLNLSKPVGISNRQKLAWRISVYLKRAIPPKIHNKQNKLIKDEDKRKINKNKTKIRLLPIKRPIESKSQQPSKSNTMKPFFNKGHFRIIEDFVKSKNFHLFTTKTGIQPLAGKILSLQMKTRLFCPLREKFSVEDKIFALSLYKKFGPKKYKDLSEFCALPPVKSLFDIMKHIPFLPGLRQQVFDNLKRSIVKLDDTDKYCSVIFQEIPLARELSETNENDEFDVENLDDNDKLTGDNVVIIMLRGLNRDWRQPVAFYLTKGKIQSYDLATLLKEVIISALEISFKVVAVVFNKKESYIETVSLLNSESLFSVEEDDRTSNIDIIEADSNRDSYPEAPNKSESNQLRNIAQKKPIWTNGYVLHLRNNEIALLYNPTNLLRVVRNKWLTYDISFAENGKVKQASWNHIMKLYSVDEGNEDTKFCPKLTQHHVIIDEIDKGSIRCCTQVFSQRVSSIMRCLTKLGVFGTDNSAIDTADVLLFFDKLFDSFNGTNNIPVRGKPLRCSVKAGSPHKDFWRSASTILSSMRFMTPFKEESTVFNLWLTTLGSMHRLCDRLLKQRGLNNIPLGHLNCDPLETFTSFLLNQDAFTIRPTYEMFRESFKTLLFSGDYMNEDMNSYQIHQLDSLRSYIYDEQPKTLLGI